MSSPINELHEIRDKINQVKEDLDELVSDIDIFLINHNIEEQLDEE